MMKIFSRAFALWLPLSVAITGAFAFAYWAVQQEYRMGANDPQIGTAENGAALLDAGGVPAELVLRTNPSSAGAPSVDIAQDASPWIAVFDASGTPLESSGKIGNEPLRLPPGVFDTSTWKRTYAEQGISMEIPSQETRFSWQPSPDIRQAVVLVRAKNGSFVASGRSLRETESRIATLTRGAALLWGASELAALMVIILMLALG